MRARQLKRAKQSLNFNAIGLLHHHQPYGKFLFHSQPPLDTNQAMAIDRTELQKIAQARLKDSEALLQAKRYEGAIYLCGYAIELALKAKICETLRWESGYPSSNKEFEDLRSFRTHNLRVLLHLSGIEDKISDNFISEWSTVTTWDPSMRYEPTGKAAHKDANLMINSVKIILEALCSNS